MGWLDDVVVDVEPVVVDGTDGELAVVGLVV